MAKLSRLIAALAVIASVQAARADERATVVTVNYALQFLAERLLGDGAEITFPVPKGTDPSFWRPAIKEISMIQSADLIVLNGAGFATWVDRVTLPRARVVTTTAAVEDQYVVTESITHSHGDGGEHSHEGLAAYTWLDPMLAEAQAEAIAAAALRRSVAQDGDLERRLVALKSDLAALDAAAQETLAPLGAVSMVATHPRYQYVARRYDLTIASLEWEAGAMPSAEDLSDLDALVSETGARILIWEAAPPEAALEAVRARGLQSVVFSTLAHAPAEGDFLAAYRAALSGFARAAEEISAGN